MPVAADGTVRRATTYTYDPLGRQTKTTHGADTREVTYLADTQHSWGETASSATDTANWAVGPDGTPLDVTNTTVAQILHSDGQGSIDLATIGTTTKCAAVMDPWGDQTTPCTAGATPNTIWYHDGRRDPATGTYQAGNRTYNPTTATWFTPDGPIGPTAGANLSVGVDPYTLNSTAYVNGDPINYSDPTGHGAGSCPAGEVRMSTPIDTETFLAGGSNSACLPPDYGTAVPFVGSLKSAAHAIASAPSNVAHAVVGGVSSAAKAVGHAATSALNFLGQHWRIVAVAGAVIVVVGGTLVACAFTEGLACAAIPAEVAAAEPEVQAVLEEATTAEEEATAAASELAETSNRATAPEPSEPAAEATGGRPADVGADASPAGAEPPPAGSIRDVNPLGGTMNCVNCAVAGDATLGGNPATALNSDGAQPVSILERAFGGRFSPVGGRTAIEQMLSDVGPGARGIVYGDRGAEQFGHVFNAINQGGNIRFLDAQAGGPATFEDGYIGFRFLWTNIP